MGRRGRVVGADPGATHQLCCAVQGKTHPTVIPIGPINGMRMIIK